MKDLSHSAFIENQQEQSDEEIRFYFSIHLRGDSQFCLPTPIKSIYIGSAGLCMCMVAVADFHGAVFKMHLYLRVLCMNVVYELCLCVCVCVP